MGVQAAMPVVDDARPRAFCIMSRLVILSGKVKFQSEP